MDTTKIGIEIYLGLISEWRKLSFAEKAIRLDSPSPSTPLEAIHELQDVIVDLIDHIDQLKDEDTDRKIVTLVDISKCIDPRFGFILPKLRGIVTVTQNQPYDNYQISFLETYAEILFNVLEHFFTKSARIQIHQAGLISKTIILPMCHSTPANYNISTQDFDAKFKILQGSLENCARAIRRSINQNNDSQLIDPKINLDEAKEAMAAATQKLIKAIPHAKRKHGLYSQLTIASLCHLSRATINRWECGPGAKDDKTNPTNRYGYYKSLRTNPDLKDALATTIKLILKDKAICDADRGTNIPKGRKLRKQRRTILPFDETKKEEKKLALEGYLLDQRS